MYLNNILDGKNCDTVKKYFLSPGDFSISEKLELLAIVSKNIYTKHSSIYGALLELQKSNRSIRTPLSPTLVNKLLEDILILTVKKDYSIATVIKDKYDYVNFSVLLSNILEVQHYELVLDIKLSTHNVPSGGSDLDILLKYFDIDFLIKLYLLILLITE